MPKPELMRVFDDMVAKAAQTLSKVTGDGLAGPSTDPERNTFLIEDLISILMHLSTHTGQILWITKMLNEGALDELWMRTHKHEGGWRRK